MRKLLLVFLGLINILVFGQFANKNIFVDALYLPADPNITCILTYRISYDQLVFTKKNSEFHANFRITAEAFDSTEKSLIRGIKDKNITLSSYDLTTRNDLFVQGFVEFKIPKTNFHIVPIYADLNSGYEQRLKDFTFSLRDFNAVHVFNPIVVNSDKSNIDDETSCVVTNYQGDVPFSSGKYSLIFVSDDTTNSNLEVEIKNNDSVLVSKKLLEYFSGSVMARDTNNIIELVKNKNTNGTKIFILNDVNAKAFEGSLQIKLSANKKSTMFNKKVEWFLKPRTLQNHEYAIKILNYIASEEEIKKINNASDKNENSVFFEFWKKFDPTPETTFNELMNEYYERADYAIINYSILGKTNGAETDRGKIYILYGKPDDVKRIYSNSNDITEIWTYNSPQNKFVFKDKTGTGSFTLESHQ